VSVNANANDVAQLSTYMLTALSVHRATAVALVSSGTALFIRQSATNENGVVHRAASAYVSRLDDQFRSMFMPARGARVAWFQLCGVLGLLALRGFIFSDALVVAAFAVLIAPAVVVGVMMRRRLLQIAIQVPGFALALANALKTTASIGDALHVTVSVTARPLRDELETALKQVRIGSTLEDALLAMAARAQSASLDVVVSALLIGRQTGGDLPRILEGTALSLRELRRLEELTDKVTRGARISLGIAAAVAVGFLIFLPRVIPGFFDPLKETVKGQLILLQGGIVFILALYLGYRFSRSDV
jgi:tight adherence protein B